MNDTAADEVIAPVPSDKLASRNAALGLIKNDMQTIRHGNERSGEQLLSVPESDHIGLMFTRFQSMYGVDPMYISPHDKKTLTHQGGMIFTLSHIDDIFDGIGG